MSGGRNEGGKELRCGQPERKAATVSARANYDPTWRVKGNPICITRRAGYRHETAISPLHARIPFSSSSPPPVDPAVDQALPGPARPRDIYRDR